MANGSKALMPICIVGMHRSGTSMVARVLREAGLYLGRDEELMPANEANPEGYWENLRFVEINNEVLTALGGAWDWPPTFPSNWRRLRVFRVLLERGRALAESFAEHEPWGWKDPRNAVTLPFWIEAVHDMKFVVCLRNPLAVAQSLAKRNPSGSPQAGYALWQVYYDRIFAQTRGRDCIVTRFDSYFDDFDAECRRLLRFVGLPNGKRTVARCRQTVVPALRHHRVETDLVAAGVPDLVVSTYRLLSSAVAPSRGNRSDTRYLLNLLRPNDLQREIESLRQELVSSSERATATIAEARQRAQHLEEVHARTLADLGDLQLRTAELEHIAGDLRADRDRWRALALKPGVVRPILRTLAADLASTWSSLPEDVRQVIRRVAWKTPGLQALRRLERQMRLPDAPLEQPFADARQDL